MFGPGDDEDEEFVGDDFDPPLDEDYQDRFDDDPSPYAGTYSED